MGHQDSQDDYHDCWEALASCCDFVARILGILCNFTQNGEHDHQLQILVEDYPMGHENTQERQLAQENEVESLA